MDIDKNVLIQYLYQENLKKDKTFENLLSKLDGLTEELSDLRKTLDKLAVENNKHQ